MAILNVQTGTLGSFNPGLALAAGLLVPLTAQLDGLIGVALGPLQADLATQLNASLAAQATLSVQVGDPTAALRLAIAAVGQLQAALSAALALPPVNVSIGAELAAAAALIASLQARLGLISLAIEAALGVKLAAVKAATDLQAHLGAGPVVAIAFGGDSWTAEGVKLANLFNGATVDGHSITGLVPSSGVLGGIVLVTGDASAAAALSAIITVP